MSKHFTSTFRATVLKSDMLMKITDDEEENMAAGEMPNLEGVMTTYFSV